MAQHDQWQHGALTGDDGAIDRLDAALTRIAAAAGRRQDAMRVAELTARAAQHETELLQQAQEAREALEREQAAAALANAEQEAGRHRAEMVELAARLDRLIGLVREVLPDFRAGEAGGAEALHHRAPDPAEDEAPDASTAGTPAHAGSGMDAGEGT